MIILFKYYGFKFILINIYYYFYVKSIIKQYKLNLLCGQSINFE